MSTKETLMKYSIPGAVIVAGLLIASAIMVTGWKSGSDNEVKVEPGTIEENGAPTADAFKNVSPVTDTDHVLGNKDAKVKIVTFSDMECPFCIRFESTMKQVISDYNGQVAWVYRHYPLESLHQSAKPAAEASECAVEIGGPAKFWDFMTKFTEVAENGSGGKIDVAAVAKQAGVDISSCVGKGKYDGKIAEQMDDANNSGFEGTPYSVVIVDGTPVTTINGAYPADEVKKIVDQYLK